MPSLMSTELPTATKCLADDVTIDPAWLLEQTDRLLGFEVLQHALKADFHGMDATKLAERVALDKNVSYRITQRIKRELT